VVTEDNATGPYRHWVLTIEPPVATLTSRKTGDAGQADVELSGALQQLRFEHPEVTVIEITGTAPGRSSEIRLAPPGSTERGPEREAVELGPLWCEEFEGGFAYPNLRVEFNEPAGTAVLTVAGPANHECFAPEPGPRRLRSHWWPLAVCRELDDALRSLRDDSPTIHTLVLRTEGDPLAVASADVALTSGYEHDWFVREVVLYWMRTLRRLDRATQSVIALVEPGSCFVGTLLELAFAADRISMVDGGDSDDPPAQIFLTGMNFGPLPAAGGLTRLELRFARREGHLALLSQRVGDPISAAEAAELGLVGCQPSETPGTNR
jgi:benzoyl-CoA-dihydrodiol lyase